MSKLRNALWNSLCLVAICSILGCSSPTESSSSSEDIRRNGDGERVNSNQASAMTSIPDVEPAENMELNTQLFLAMEILGKEQRIRRLEKLLESGASPNAVDSTGDPILSLAALLGGCEDVRLLLDHGADIEAENSVGKTALISCFDTISILPEVNDSSGYFRSKCTMELLISRGADTNHRTNLGWTPIYIAVQNDNVDAARVLLEHGVDPDLSNITEMWALNGETISAREAVEKNGINEMRALFARFPPKK